MNHYQTLQVNPQATQQEIKQAYRRLVKLFHPDTQKVTADRDKIIQINAAYEILSNPKSRRYYDQQISPHWDTGFSSDRQQRTAQAQQQYQRYRQAERAEEVFCQGWVKNVYQTINLLIGKILNPLEAEIDSLSGDPFDDELMAAFQAYLEDCSQYLQQAQQIFASQPNPPELAGVAANLYYCLNQIGDGIRELEWFALNYDDHYLHTGQEIFRIARGLRYQAQAKVQTWV